VVKVIVRFADCPFECFPDENAYPTLIGFKHLLVLLMSLSRKVALQTFQRRMTPQGVRGTFGFAGVIVGRSVSSSPLIYAARLPDPPGYRRLRAQRVVPKRDADPARGYLHL
jgi:hypothetical protein